MLGLLKFSVRLSPGHTCPSSARFRPTSSILTCLALASLVAALQIPTNTSHPISNTTLESSRRDCTRRPLTVALWQELDLDNYIENYVGGKTLKLQAYADEVNVTNFICGIGQTCDAGQLCSSAMAPDWYVLVATQNWSKVMNMLYTSLSFGIGAMQDIAPLMINDLSPPSSPTPVASATWLALVASFSGALPGMIFPGMWVWIWVFLQGLLYTTASEMWFWQNVIRAPPDVRSGYTRWIEFAWMLSNLEDKSQEKLSNYTKGVLQSGISTEEGMYGVLKNGAFLQRTIEKTQYNLQASFEAVIKLRLLAAILKAQSVFIIRNSDPCTQSGPGGAFEGKGVLSYCGPDQVMMTIVRAKGTKTHRKIYGASLIESKYGFTTEFLTNSAWKCQTKYGGYEHDPYTNSTLPTDINADCLFNLPVCDCGSPDVLTRRKKGVRTVKACLRAGVPIHPSGPQFT
ncbi:hypothetical protein MJO28_017161 [Puccinia striiformis f. sp. tritici]|uniref:hypothetical protein n=1 Tax=Puccinia striiformis f. sp. tritici TaxID=168172 RepID=UPI002007429C|nr:hypothetical protein Pst134EA_019513 [Puccinia striiformis f. sp. tritici]KAH9459361.1 hypothetical protein Pst134EA_019513 [Puccinia striiformis f. sp. tritici]KAI7934315.1 hypothetical protein MJO28_017161 [Puccinia striiformis f. sp. tritici]KAI9618756.1 hypothetical protein KEM48_006521 [Puccinia striiformis f. sp. tritici PST-130]